MAPSGTSLTSVKNRKNGSIKIEHDFDTYTVLGYSGGIHIRKDERLIQDLLQDVLESPESGQATVGASVLSPPKTLIIHPAID